MGEGREWSVLQITRHVVAVDGVQEEEEEEEEEEADVAEEEENFLVMLPYFVPNEKSFRNFFERKAPQEKEKLR
ncbi:hypothetical protein RUM44_007258 [Polyplax serrata]|uniref:Uncharacterized protein n=1 Tax=Polyplax serrata TaxID=468196 RepID=A0ABR1B068_POLSC